MTTSKVPSGSNSDALSIAANSAGLATSTLTAAREWLAEQLVAQQYAKLGQGGHTNTEVPLRQVFVDLPVAWSLNALSTHEPRSRFLKQLFASTPLDLSNVFATREGGDPSARMHMEGKREEAEEEDSETDFTHSPPWSFHSAHLGAALLIGGPGQGKSTLGQLACQVHRAALLLPIEDELTTRQSSLVRSLDFSRTTKPEQVDEQFHQRARAPLLPLQIALPDFAAWLSRQQVDGSSQELPVILQFLAEQPSAKKCNLSAEALLGLASNMGSLLVLDGFDEVGATQDRERIVVAGRSLLTALAKRKAHAQVLATTRPQGYADELARLGLPFQKCFLAPLQKEEAMGYARKLVDAKIQGIDEREATFNKLKEAANEPATERLLTTPLQVTILTALVQQQGRAPRERWNLFYTYFDYTIKREIERGSYASALLVEHRKHIEQVHARVALLLQVAAERDGGAAARMPRAQLEEVIEEVLTEDEVAEKRRRVLVPEIATAAEKRLVFLVEPEPGSIGFEIRSLQEFMAAWALTSGRELHIEARLQQVSKAPMFRNVALFVASRLFCDSSPLREVIADRICGGLDDDPVDELQRITHAGALLALETLEEGAVLSQPKHARALMARATGLLALPAAAEHIRLYRVANDDTVDLLREVIEQRLGDSTNHQNLTKLSAWICLLDAVNRDELWAIQVAEKFWSATAHLPTLLEACERLDLPIGPWLATKIEFAAGSISPVSFVNLAMLGGSHGYNLSWVGWLNTVRREVLRLRRESAHFPTVATVGTRDKFKNWALPKSTKPQGWAAWIEATIFEMAPTAQQLGVVLKSIANTLPEKEWQQLRDISSWPLATCLLAAQSPGQLEYFGTLATKQELGDIVDWRNSERQAAGKINLLSLFEHHPTNLPWTVESLKKTTPLLAIRQWRFFNRIKKGMRSPSAQELLGLANDAIKVSAFKSERSILAELCFLVTRTTKQKTLSKNLDPMTWVAAAPQSAGFLVPRPAWLSIPQWIELLDACDVKQAFSWYVNVAANFDALAEAPGHPVLLRLAVLSVELYVTHIFAHEPLNPVQIEKALLAVECQNATTTESLADLAILRLFLGASSPEQDDPLFQDIVTAARSNGDLWGAVLSALPKSRIPRPRLNVLLAKTYRAMGEAHPQSNIATKLLKDALQKQTSDLDSQATWSRLALPLPFPSNPGPERLDGGIPKQPVIIQSLEVRDIGGIHALKIEFAVPSENCGQWVVVLGPNGIGKTTLLRSLVLALRSVKHIGIWPSGAFSHLWARQQAEHESITVDASITVKLGDGMVHRTHIRTTDSNGITQSPEQDNAHLFPLFAYGCHRGSALGGASRQVNLSSDSGPEIATLFDQGADLIQAETWLVALEGDTYKNPRSKIIYDNFVSAIKDMLGLAELEVIDQKVWVTELGRPKLPFSALSDGYLTYAGWFFDLVARWIDLAARNGQLINANFLSQMRGLVLIDEIDIHLHPRWQIEIISRTRRLLPQMSFIVTTHNPLTLVGAKAEEIWVLSTKEGQVKATAGVDAPMLLTGGQIYRRYFGIEDIYPNGLGRALQRFSFLSGYALRNDVEQAELEALQKQLREAELDPGWDVVDRTSIQSLPVKKIDSKTPTSHAKEGGT